MGPKLQVGTEFVVRLYDATRPREEVAMLSPDVYDPTYYDIGKGLRTVAAAMRLSEAIGEYLAVLAAQGQSPSTIKCKRSALLRFLGTTGNIYPKNLRPQHVDAFLVEHAHWQPATKQTHIAYLSHFQDWLKSRRMLDRGEDILEGRRKVKVPKKRKPRVKYDKFETLLERALNPRDRAVLALGLYLAVRVSEMNSIQWKHVDLDAGYIDIYRQKTGEPDTLPVIGELHEELVRWRTEVCRRVNAIAPDPEWYVLCTLDRVRGRDAKGQYMGSVGEMVLIPERPLLYPIRRIKDILASVGVSEPGVGMHTLRRSGAQALLDAGEDIRVVQAMLGHSTQERTEIYLDRDIDRQRRNERLRGKFLYGGDQPKADVVPIKREVS